MPRKQPLAPIIIATPEMEEELVRALYVLPPPGERTLYTHLFADPVFLRTGVELRGYVAAQLR